MRLIALLRRMQPRNGIIEESKRRLFLVEENNDDDVIPIRGEEYNYGNDIVNIENNIREALRIGITIPLDKYRQEHI